MTDLYPGIYFCEQCLRTWNVKDGIEVSEGPLKHFKEYHHSIICVSDILRLPYFPQAIFKFMDDSQKEKIKSCLNDYLLVAERCKGSINLSNILDLQRAYQTLLDSARLHKK